MGGRTEALPADSVALEEAKAAASWATAAAADGGVEAAAAELPERPLAHCLRFPWASFDAVSFARA